MKFFGVHIIFMIIKILTDPEKKNANIGFAIIGRLINTDGKIVFVEYSSRIITWETFFSEEKSNIWNYIETTEPSSIIKNTYFENVHNEFMNKAGGHLKAFALSELEFNEAVPFLKEGIYTCFVEHLNED